MSDALARKLQIAKFADRVENFLLTQRILPEMDAFLTVLVFGLKK